MYSKEEVVELLKEFQGGYFAEYQMDRFFKEKGLIEQFEVGKWYKGKNFYDFIGCITAMDDEDFRYYGLNVNEHWKDDDFYTFKEANLIEATPKEVEEALIKEAKKRGFKKGVEYQDISGYEGKP